MVGFPYPEVPKKPLFFCLLSFIAVACCVQGDTGMKGRWQGFFFFFGSPLIAQNLVEAVASVFCHRLLATRDKRYEL